MGLLLITFAKTTLSFLALWGTTRLLGKRQISQITYFDYITGITIGSLAANLMSPEHNWKAMLAALVIWGILTYLFHWLSLKSEQLRKLLDGEPTVLIRHGQLIYSSLRKAQMNVQELMSLLRARGHFSPKHVEFATLETNGELSVLPQSQYRAVQPRDLHLSTEYEGMPIQVMHERRPLTEALGRVGLTADWLYRQLQTQGAEDPSQIFAAWLGPNGNLVIAYYDDLVH